MTQKHHATGFYLWHFFRKMSESPIDETVIHDRIWAKRSNLLSAFRKRCTMAKNIGSKNITLMATKDAALAAAMPMVNGSLVQLFLTNRSVDAYHVGLFSTLVSIVMVVGTMVCSYLSEKFPKPLTQYRWLFFLQMAIYLAMIPIAYFTMTPAGLFWLLSLIACAITFLYSWNTILGYKIPYMTIPFESYGSYTAVSGAVTGIVGVVSSFAFSAVINGNWGGKPYLVCIVITTVLMIVAWYCTYRLTPVNNVYDGQSHNNMNIRKILEVFSMPLFRKFVVPNTLRGITIGITNSIALIALYMGLTEGEASTLPIICALGYVVSSFLFHFLSKHMPLPTVALIGSLLVLPLISLPHDNSTVFLSVFLVAYIGRVIVDYAIPVMLIHVVPAEIAGTYNAGRYILLNLSSTVSVFAVGALLGRISALWLLSACALAYIIGMIWYMILYKKYMR